jgi:hypothetical protein
VRRRERKGKREQEEMKKQKSEKALFFLSILRINYSAGVPMSGGRERCHVR